MSFTTQESIVEQELTDYGMRRICIDKTGVGSGMVQSLVKKWHAQVWQLPSRTISGRDDHDGERLCRKGACTSPERARFKRDLPCSAGS